MKCNFCYKVFREIAVLFQHLKIFHAYERCYICINDGCLRKFVSIATMKKHCLRCDKLEIKRFVSSKINDNTPQMEKSKNVSRKNLLKSDTLKEVNTKNSIPCIVKQNEHLDNNGDDTIEKCIEDAILAFIGKLYTGNIVTKSVIEEVVTEFIKSIENVISLYTEKLKLLFPAEYHSKIENMRYIKALDNLRSDFKRMQFLKRTNVLIEPKPFLLGEIDDDKKENNATALKKKKCYGYIISIREVLKNFLELPNVFNIIKDFMNSEQAVGIDKKIYYNLFQGKRWNEILKAYGDKIVIPLYFYFDDFEINNSLSTAAGIHKIGGLYFSIAALPPRFSSTLDNIFLGQFIYTSDHKEFDNKKCFYILVQELKFLANEGIIINVNNEQKRVYFVVLGILGDNLGLNTIYGFKKSFSSNYYCRICRASKEDAKTLCRECTGLIRTVSNYQEDLKNRSFGVTSECVFNDIPHFHNVLNNVCDIMHDVYLGIARYNMAKIIQHCIQSNTFR